MTEHLRSTVPASTKSNIEEERIARIEEKKDALSLKRELRFVELYKDLYRQKMRDFFEREPNETSSEFAQSIEIVGYDLEKAQISVEHIQQMVSRIPAALIARSNLAQINFEFQDYVPVPSFDEEGNFEGSGVKLMKIDEFVSSEYNQYRILIGQTRHYFVDTGEGERVLRSQITETGIPPTISSDSEAVLHYQTHVFVHELFHTIEGAHFSEERARAWVLNPSTGRTFYDWKLEYAQACIEEPVPGSYYAGVYTDELFASEGGAPDLLGVPLREWMCEDFVGVILGIVPSNAGGVEFKDRVFAIGDNALVPSRRYKLIQELLTPTYS
jgi:hypothetical protein